MKNLNCFINLSFKFCAKILLQYLKELLIPLLIGLGGLVFFVPMFFDRILALVGLLYIPCFAYAFWRGFVVTYALNFAAVNYSKNEEFSFKNCIERVNQKDYALWVTFSAFFTLFLFVPAFVLICAVPFFIAEKNTELLPLYIIMGIIAAFLNIILLLPFSTFFNQAYFFKKKDENYFKLFLNCYKNLDMAGVAVIFLVGVFQTIVSSVTYFLSPLFLLALNPVIYSLCLFWYQERIENKKIEK